MMEKQINLSSEIKKKSIEKKVCVSCKHELPLILDNFKCPTCGVKNR